MKIRELYLSSARTTRLAVACLLIGLATLISYVNEVNPLITAGVGLGILVFFEFLFSKPKAFWLTVIWALSIILLTGFSFIVYLVFGQVYGEDQGIFAAGLVLLAGIPSMALAGTLIWLTGYGSPALNLITTLAVYLITLATTFAPLGQINLLLPLGVSFVSGFIYPLLNWWLGKKISKRREAKQDYVYPDGRLTTLLEQDIQEVFPTENIINENYHIVTSNNKHYVILPLAGETKNSITLNENFLKVDDKDYTWVLDRVAEEAREYSRTSKVPQKNITPVVVVPKITPAKQVTPVTLRSRFQPQKNLGTVLIVTKSKLNSL